MNVPAVAASAIAEVIRKRDEGLHIRSYRRQLAGARALECCGLWWRDTVMKFWRLLIPTLP